MNQVEQWVQRGFGVLIIPVVLAASYALAELSWLVVVPNSALPASTSMSLPLVAPGNMAAASRPMDLRALSRWSLFGEQPKAEPKPAPIKQDEAIKAPETKLNLELHGVFVATDPMKSTAIIAEARSRGEDNKLLYAIGDQLPGNATLERVFADRIILRRNGRVETLRFTKDEEGMLVDGDPFDASSVRNASQAVASRSSGNSLAGNPQSVTTGRPSPVAEKQPANAERLGGITKTPPAELARDPINNPLFNGLRNQTEATLTQLGLSAIDPSEGGGYLITSSAPRQLLNMLPVSVGDRILSVNGQTLGDPAQDQALFQQVLSHESIQVELQKGQTRLTVDINLRDLMGGGR